MPEYTVPANTGPAFEPSEPTEPIYEDLAGFTDRDIATIARFVGIDGPTVDRLVDCIRLAKTLEPGRPGHLRRVLVEIEALARREAASGKGSPQYLAGLNEAAERVRRVLTVSPHD